MSNTVNPAAESEVIPHNIYFEGKVQSLGLETPNGKATLGVMKKGAYTFSTSSPEKMVIVSGSMDVKLDDNGYKTYTEKDEFSIVAGISFEVKCTTDVAYICYYG